jgi:GTP:adenosylcobinamide-phosphate guanylyltransferase
MDAIITAGGIPQPSEPLYVYSNGGSKAMIDVAGKPMIQWVLDALSNAKHVDNIIVIGITPNNKLTSKKPLYYIPNQGKMLANMIKGVEKSIELNQKNKYVLIVSSDIPAVKAEMVDWLTKTCMETQDDLYYGVCPRNVMEKRYPSSRRTYTHLKDMDVCGADMNIINVRMASEHLDTWEALIANRKNPAGLAMVMGLDTALQLLTRQATLADYVARVSKRIGIKGRAIVWPYAEPCMDVDKPNQLEMIAADLARTARKSSAKGGARQKPLKRAKAKPVKQAAVRPTRKAKKKKK